MVEPTACSPASGWEKGQVENQVQTARGRFFQPRLRFAGIEELNGWLEAKCRRWAEMAKVPAMHSIVGKPSEGDMHQHPEQKELTVAQAWAAERGALQPVVAPFEGFHESQQAVSGTCLISFDRNRYSVSARAVRRAVQVRAYACPERRGRRRRRADRIIVRCDG